MENSPNSTDQYNYHGNTPLDERKYLQLHYND